MAGLWLLACFVTMFVKTQELIPRGLLETEDYAYEYGHTDHEDADGYVKISGGETDILLVFDEGGREEVIFVADLGFGRIGVVMECYLKNDEDEYRRIRSVVMLIDAEGAIIISAKVTREIKGLANYDHLLVLETAYLTEYYDHEFAKRTFLPPVADQSGGFVFHHRGEAEINGEPVGEIRLLNPGNYDIVIHGLNHSLAFSLTLHPDLVGIDDGGRYHETLTIACAGDLSLNGNPIESGLILDAAGHHELVVRGVNDYVMRREFTLEAEISGVYAGMVTNDPVRIFANSQFMELNGERYDGSLVYEAGSYVFSVHGAGGYLKEIPFTILPVVFGIEDGGVYTDDVTLLLNCDAKLNGQSVARESLLSQPGAYELVCLLDGETYATYRFIIESAISETKTNQTKAVLIYILAGIALVGAVLVFKKR